MIFGFFEKSKYNYFYWPTVPHSSSMLLDSERGKDFTMMQSVVFYIYLYLKHMNYVHNSGTYKT